MRITFISTRCHFSTLRLKFLTFQRFASGRPHDTCIHPCSFIKNRPTQLTQKNDESKMEEKQIKVGYFCVRAEDGDDGSRRAAAAGTSSARLPVCM